MVYTILAPVLVLFLPTSVTGMVSAFIVFLLTGWFINVYQSVSHKSSLKLTKQHFSRGNSVGAVILETV